MNEADDKVRGEEQGGGDCGHGLELQLAPNSIQPALPFLSSGSRRAGLVITGILQGLHQSRLCRGLYKEIGGKKEAALLLANPCKGTLKEQGCLLALRFSKINWQLLEVRKPSLAWGRKL